MSVRFRSSAGTVLEGTARYSHEQAVLPRAQDNPDYSIVSGEAFVKDNATEGSAASGRGRTPNRNGR